MKNFWRFFPQGKSKTESREVNLVAADMSDVMQRDAVHFAERAISEHELEKDIAMAIKKRMDVRHNPTWQCVVGKNFGSSISYTAMNFMYFYVGNDAILLFKS
ncbi:unnamed protein product [Gordionus sp. m RMFG-2023]|uniref:dynein light chain 1, cytoplasmic-like n=1 Tax=Gordionus sp. m RMFG-2023 TaxID=3053472 RepID=UPI0030E53E5B